MSEEILLKRGAEALIILSYYGNQKAIVKHRIKKGYRLEQLDLKLRGERTRRETKLLREARALGVPTPQVYHVDEKNYKIYMEYIDGEKLKDVIGKVDEKIFYEVGKLVGRLHANGIIHGDLTTSNMIIKNGQIYFIDFGLGYFSKRIEDQGVELKLLKESIKATHPKLLSVCWENIVKGYKEEYPNADKVLKKVKEIEKRGRYVEKKDE